MYRRILIVTLALCLAHTEGRAQEKPMELSLQETIRHAQEQSPDAQSARHAYRSAY